MFFAVDDTKHKWKGQYNTYMKKKWAMRNKWSRAGADEVPDGGSQIKHLNFLEETIETAGYAFCFQSINISE